MYRALFEQAADGIFISDKQGRYVEVNRRGCQMLGYTREEMLDLSMQDLIPEEELARAPLRLDELRLGSSLRKRHHLRCKDGRLLTVEISARMLADGFFLGIVRDIGERELAEQELQRSNDLLQAIIKAAPVAIIGLDLEGNVQWVWNPATEKMLDWKAEEVMGRPFPSVPVEGMAEFRGFRERIRSGLTLDGVEVRRQRRDGSPIDYSIYATPLHDNGGGIIGNIAVLVDITEHKRMEEERQAHLRFFESMDRITRAMQGTNDLQQVMNDVLDIIWAIFGCDRAFLIYPCDPEAPSWRMLMERARPELPGASALGVEVAMDADAVKSFRTILDADGPVKFGPGSQHPLPPEVAKQFSIQSQLAMAIYPKTGQPWLFGLHQCSHERIWTPEEERLFHEIGRRLTDSLSSLLAYRNLRESERRLEKAERIAHVGWWERDYGAGCITLSDEASRIFGLPPTERCHDLATWHELIHPEDRPQIVQAAADALRGGPRYDVEYRVIRPNGEMRTVHSRGDARRAVEGQPRRMFGILQDITELRQAEDELRAGEERYRALYRDNPSMFFTLDGEGTIVSVNDFGASQLGYTPAELEGQSILNLFYAEDQAPAHEQMKVCLQHPRQIFHWQFRKVRKDGSLIWVEEYARAVDRPNRDISVLVVCQDITARKQLEAENEQLTAQFYQTQKVESLGRLAGGIAHDFNNLLIPIIGYTDLGLRELTAGSKLHADLTQVKKAAKRAADLTRKILAFSRQQVLELSVLDLNVVIVEFNQMLRRMIGEDVLLQTFLSSTLDPVKADRGQIEQVLMNLAINSRDAMPGGGKLSIETENAFLDEAYVRKYAGDLSPGRYIMLAVSDTGQGMDAETQRRIFEPFFTTKASGKGTGLGLAIAYGIIKQHQGHISVYSEPGHGTTFKIYLPQAKETLPGLLPSIKEPTSMFGTETVLVAEDEDMVRKLVCETLQAHGYDVVEAASPTGCLELASTRATIHLLLTDVIMPEMNGQELYRKLTAIHPNCRVLYMSGYTNHVIADLDILGKGVNFLQKPFTIQDLIKKVREVLE
ncbi:MAG: hypothetical protein A2X81_00635 [Desulfobacterales bacterium GWB2_56_26]|nr:MAG: hypothetical protein A2X81_00635 [Desulfobacterales bacterium GWB2_56_26]